MNVSKCLIFLSVAILLRNVLAKSIISGANLDLSAKWSVAGYTEHTVPQLTFKEENCYRKSQNCCYKYHECGKHCKNNICTYVSECSIYQNGQCKQHRTHKVCKATCYHKMCPKYYCAPLDTHTTGAYKIPEPHKEVEASADNYSH